MNQRPNNYITTDDLAFSVFENARASSHQIRSKKIEKFFVFEVGALDAYQIKDEFINGDFLSFYNEP